MEEYFKIILTASTTVIAGVIIISAGQVISSFFIEPLHKQKITIGRIVDCMIYYANVYTNPGTGIVERRDEASRETRKLASELVARTNAIPQYTLCYRMGLVLSIKNIKEAHTNLIRLSNSTHSGKPLENDEWIREIQSALGIATEFYG